MRIRIRIPNIGVHSLDTFQGHVRGPRAAGGRAVPPTRPPPRANADRRRTVPTKFVGRRKVPKKFAGCQPGKNVARRRLLRVKVPRRRLPRRRQAKTIWRRSTGSTRSGRKRASGERRRNYSDTSPGSSSSLTSRMVCQFSVTLYILC